MADHIMNSIHDLLAIGFESTSGPDNNGKDHHHPQRYLVIECKHEVTRERCIADARTKNAPLLLCLDRGGEGKEGGRDPPDPRWRWLKAWR
jgi:hypothetical protein